MSLVGVARNRAAENPSPRRPPIAASGRLFMPERTPTCPQAIAPPKTGWPDPLHRGRDAARPQRARIGPYSALSFGTGGTVSHIAQGDAAPLCSDRHCEPDPAGARHGRPRLRHDRDRHRRADFLKWLPCSVCDCRSRSVRPALAGVVGPASSSLTLSTFHLSGRTQRFGMNAPVISACSGRSFRCRERRRHLRTCRCSSRPAFMEPAQPSASSKRRCSTALGQQHDESEAARHPGDRDSQLLEPLDLHALPA